jgi:hypothetical protein
MAWWRGGEVAKKKQEQDFNVQDYRKKLIYSLMQSVDGVIFQGNRAIETFKTYQNVGIPSINYTFRHDRFELSLFIQCLNIVVLFVDDLRNSKDDRLRFDNLQKIKSKINKVINRKILIEVRNNWMHLEKTLLGKLRDKKESYDVINNGLPAAFWMQVVNGEILLSNRICAINDDRKNIVWLTNDYISVQKVIELFSEIRNEIEEIYTIMDVS